MIVEQLSVCMELEGRELEVGELVSTGRRIHFKYYPSFLTNDLNLSPIRLPLKNGVQTGPAFPFDGLHGVFADSLPEGWGKLLMDRALRSLGIDPFGIGPLERLAFIGDRGVGALTYAPSKNIASTDEIAIDLDRISAQVTQVLAGASAEVVDLLFHLGGSSGGARPKVNVGYDSEFDRLYTESNSVNEGVEQWLIKFAASNDFDDIANVEYAYHLMARAAGIEMSECRLFTGKSGRQYFGTKRFDRISTGKLHMHSAAGMMHDDFRHSQMDYGHLMDCAFQLERDIRAYAKVLRLAAFNVFAHNRDDHSRNFSFLMNGSGAWKFAPAYDLTFSATGHGMHSTTIAGEGSNPGRSHLMTLARTFNIKNAKSIISQVIEAVSRWEEFAEEAGVSERTFHEINETLRIRLP